MERRSWRPCSGFAVSTAKSAARRATLSSNRSRMSSCRGRLVALDGEQIVGPAAEQKIGEAALGK